MSETRIIAEMLLTDSVEERKRIWQAHKDYLDSMQMYIMKRDNRTIEKYKRRDEAWAAVPWWRRFWRQPPMPHEMGIE